MRKIMVIAKREYQAALRTKSFLVSMALLPLMIGGSALLQIFMQNVEETRVKRIAIVDRTPGEKLLLKIKKATESGPRARQATNPLREPTEGSAYEVVREEPSADTPGEIRRQRFDLSEKVQSGELAGFLDIGPEVLRATAPAGRDVSAAVGMAAGSWLERLAGVAAVIPVPGERNGIRYQSRTPALDPFPRWVDEIVNEAVQEERGQALGLSRDQVRALMAPVPLLYRGLSPRPGLAEAKETPATVQLASFLIPAVLMALMFTMILFGATPLMHGVVEEKMQRIAEVLLGSVRPFDLMLGKLLGMVAVSLTVLAVYLAGAFWAARHYGFAEYVPASLLGWFVLFQVLAVLMYGSLFIAIGAACTDTKETQLLVLPVVLLASLPMILMRSVIQDPNSGVVTALSYFPLSTPMLMIGRLALGPGIPLWQTLLGVLDVLTVTVIFVYAAGRIFRVGLLLQGKGAKVGELIRWVVRG